MAALGLAVARRRLAKAARKEGVMRAPREVCWTINSSRLLAAGDRTRRNIARQRFFEGYLEKIPLLDTLSLSTRGRGGRLSRRQLSF
jgi:hypothetical protein